MPRDCKEKWGFPKKVHKQAAVFPKTAACSITFYEKQNNQIEKYKNDLSPIEEGCQCPTCQRHSRAYIRHLFKAGEMLAMRLCVMHNLYFYNTLLAKIRAQIENGTFDSFKNEYVEKLDTRI